MITVKNAGNLGSRNPAKPAEAPVKPDPIEGVLRGLAAALDGLTAEIKRDRVPPSIPAPKVEVTVQQPEKPRKWLFKVNRNTRGEIAEIAAEALD